MLTPTFRAGADSPQRTRAAAAVLLLVVRVPQLARGRAVRQPHLDVGQVTPVGAGGQGDVSHPRRDQGAHVLQTPSLPSPPTIGERPSARWRGKGLRGTPVSPAPGLWPHSYHWRRLRERERSQQLHQPSFPLKLPSLGINTHRDCLGMSSPRLLSTHQTSLP